MAAGGLIGTADSRATSVQSAKSALRHAAFAQRKLISPEQRAAAAQQLTTQADALIGTLADGLQPGATVAAYVSMGTEIETRPLLNALLNARMRVIVPLLGSGLEIGWGELRSLDDLHAVHTDVNATMSSGHLHQRPEEPSPTPPATDATALRNASLIILPALAVDRHGTRLGRGGGWYDRALTYRATNAPIIAVCWPWELVASDLPREPHDVPVNAVLTPDGVTWLSVN